MLLIYRNQLVTSVSLDYEEIQQYKLKLCVTDLGDRLVPAIGSGGSGNGYVTSVDHLPQDHVDCITVVVDVIDENDNPPEFVGGVDSYSFSVDEEQSANTPVGFVNVRKTNFSFDFFS